MAVSLDELLGREEQTAAIFLLPEEFLRDPGMDAVSLDGFCLILVE